MSEDAQPISSRPENTTPKNGEPQRNSGLLGWIRSLTGSKNGDSALRDTFEELIEEHEERVASIDPGERALIENILNLGGLTARDVMVPRVDIGAVEVNTSLEDLVGLINTEAHSRLPIYRETLDDVIGMVHIKDVLAEMGKDAGFSLRRILRKILFVAPTMPVLDLLLQMQMTQLHMALVVDEYGGIDGLITIEDLVEQIVGEIKDEHDADPGPQLVHGPQGSVVADARLPIEQFEEQVGAILTEEERAEDIDTLGGLLFTLIGRVPTRGELVVHAPSGVEFEILDADPRRIKRLRVRKLPKAFASDA
jgi:CBS domain containing-hemolysin-like protein